MGRAVCPRSFSSKAMSFPVILMPQHRNGKIKNTSGFLQISMRCASSLRWSTSYVLTHILIWKAARLRAYKGNVEKRKWGQWGGGIKRRNGRNGQRWRYREGEDIEVRNKKDKERTWGHSSSDSGERGEGRRWAIFMDLRAAGLHVSSLFEYWGQKVPTPHVRRNRNSLMQPSGKLFKLLVSDLPRLEEGKWRGWPTMCARWGIPGLS